MLILAKPLDKHGTTLVQVTYPPLITVLIFAIFLEIFTYVVGENGFFYSLQLSRYPGRVSIKIKIKKKNSEEKKGKRKSGHLREK